MILDIIKNELGQLGIIEHLYSMGDEIDQYVFNKK